MQPETFQERVAPWMQHCFGPAISADRLERGDRFLEEDLELLQSGKYPKERAHALVEYVYGRPEGEPAQEVGGVMVTLAAYCLAFGLDMHAAGEAELERILRPEIMEKIRAKQAAKPTGSSLPIAAPQQVLLIADANPYDPHGPEVALLHQWFADHYSAAEWCDDGCRSENARGLLNTLAEGGFIVVPAPTMEAAR